MEEDTVYQRELQQTSRNRKTTGPNSTVSNVSDYRSRGYDFDSGPVPYICGDHEIFLIAILLLFLIHSRMVVVSYKRKYVHEILLNRLFKLAWTKLWLSEPTVLPRP